jgi:hypothetical protein
MYPVALLSSDTYLSITTFTLPALENLNGAANANKEDRIIDETINAVLQVHRVHQNVLKNDIPSAFGQHGHGVMQREVHRQPLGHGLIAPGPSWPHRVEMIDPDVESRPISYVSQCLNDTRLSTA